MWLAHGPEAARKWAEYVGIASAPALFTDPAKQAALEKALKECKPVANRGGSSYPVGSKRRRSEVSSAPPTSDELRTGKALVLRRMQCHTCGGRGHYARDCPSEKRAEPSNPT